MLKRHSFLIFLALCLWASGLFAQGDEEMSQPPVPVRAVWNASALAAGTESFLGVVFEVPKNHHITDVENGMFFVELRDTLGIDFDSAIFPKGKKYKTEISYTGNVLVKIPVKVSKEAIAGKHIWPVNVGYQICQEFGEEICFLPVDKKIMLSVEIVSAGTKTSPANEDIFKATAVGANQKNDNDDGTVSESGSLEDRLVAALNKGSWLAFLLVFIGGMLASLTPCVYPIIPITIGYIGGASKGKLHGFTLSLIFVLGIAVIYSGLGLLSAATGTLFGSISGSPIVTYAVAVIFGVMGFSMLGAFEIALPASMQSKLQSGGPKKGLLAPFVLGMVSGLVMAPCVGPVIVALLAWVSQSGNLFLGWALLFVFSLGLGVLFLVIGTFAGAIQALPRAGAWMENIKKVFGWILLAAALYLCRLAIPEPYYTLAWGVYLIIVAVFNGALDQLTEGASVGKKLSKSFAVIILFFGAIFLVKIFMPQGGGTALTQEVSWTVNKEEEAVALARDQNKPLIIDVYADWCVACVELDEKTYVVPEVIQRLEGFVRLKLDFTKQTPWVEEMKQKYKITGMPTVILYDPAGDEAARFTGFKPAKEFVSLLNQKNL